MDIASLTLNLYINAPQRTEAEFCYDWLLAFSSYCWPCGLSLEGPDSIWVFPGSIDPFGNNMETNTNGEQREADFSVLNYSRDCIQLGSNRNEFIDRLNVASDCVYLGCPLVQVVAPDNGTIFVNAYRVRQVDPEVWAPALRVSCNTSSSAATNSIIRFESKASFWSGCEVRVDDEQRNLVLKQGLKLQVAEESARLLSTAIYRTIRLIGAQIEQFEFPESDDDGFSNLLRSCMIASSNATGEKWDV